MYIIYDYSLHSAIEPHRLSEKLIGLFLCILLKASKSFKQLYAKRRPITGHIRENCDALEEDMDWLIAQHAMTTTIFVADEKVR